MENKLAMALKYNSKPMHSQNKDMDVIRLKTDIRHCITTNVTFTTGNNYAVAI